MRIEDRVAFAEAHQLSRASFRPGEFPITPPQQNGHQHSFDFALGFLKAVETNERQKGLLRASEVSYAVDLAERRSISARLHHEAIRDIRAQTTFLSVQDELEMLLHPEYQGERIWSYASIHWDSPHSINDVPVLGTYLHSGRKILIEAQRPTPAEALTQLALFGEFPAPRQILIHEEVHAVQYNLVEANSIPRELMEAQAIRTRQKSLAEVSHHRLVDDFKRTKAYKKLDPRKFETAVWIIDRLNALGFTQKEIVYLTSDAGVWDDVQGHWENIDRRLMKEMITRDLDAAGLEQLVLAYDLETATARQEAKTITQRVIYRNFRREINAWRQKLDSDRGGRQPIEV